MQTHDEDGELVGEIVGVTAAERHTHATIKNAPRRQPFILSGPITRCRKRECINCSL
jgi:hypothetical protein